MDSKLLGIIIIVICICVFIAFELKKRKTFATLVHLINNGEYGEYLLLLNTAFVKYVYPRYNRAYMKLNAYMFMEDNEEIKRLFDDMLKMKTNKKQRIDMITKAFNYYIEQENKPHCEALLKEIETFDSEQLKKDSRKIYDIFILKKHNYINEMLVQLQNATAIEKGLIEYLLSLQYVNKGNTKLSEYYLALSQKDILPNEQAFPRV